MSDGAIALPPIFEERLPNGATVVVARKKGVPLVAVRLLVHAGGALDPRGRFGLAHLVAAVARRGTRRRTGRQIDERIESLGAELGAGADEDATYFGLSAPAEFLRELLDMVADVAMDPAFPAAELERIRRREVAAMVHDLDEPAVIADRAMIAAAYGDHPYGHAVEGRRRHLEAVTRGDAAGFHRRWFAPRRTLLVVVGAVEEAQGLALARAKLGHWRGDSAEPADPPPAPPAPRSVLVVDKPEVTQTQVRIASAAMPRASPEYFPALVANAIFGGGFTSRLVDSIRVTRGLSYGVRSRFAMSRSAGLFFISTFTKVGSTADIVQVALDEVDRFCEEGPSDEELARAQSYLGGLFPLSLETHDQLAEKICDMKLYGFPPEDVTGYRERVRAVTAGECLEVARRHFPRGRGVVVAVGPAREVAPALERYGPVAVVPAARVL